MRRSLPRPRTLPLRLLRAAHRFGPGRLLLVLRLRHRQRVAQHEARGIHHSAGETSHSPICEKHVNHGGFHGPHLFLMHSRIFGVSLQYCIHTSKHFCLQAKQPRTIFAHATVIWRSQLTPPKRVQHHYFEKKRPPLGWRPHARRRLSGRISVVVRALSQTWQARQELAAASRAAALPRCRDQPLHPAPPP